MTSAMRKVAEYLGLYETDDFTEDAIDDTPEGETRPNIRSVGNDYQTTNTLERSIIDANQNGPASADIHRITTVYPRNYNEARRIGEEFRSGTVVILNVVDMEDTDARRIIDFCSGLVFGQNGAIEKISRGVFVLTPPNVEVGASARAQMREFSFYNQS